MKLRCDRALLPQGWTADVLIETDAAGSITRVGRADASGDAERIRGYVLPGMGNVHSHAFQRALAGRAEARTHATDTFWTWRERMYRCALRMTPDDMEAIATAVYVDMLKGGFTAVGEFHYLHHDTDGRRYDDPAEMSERIVAAARHAGIALTHLPVLYAHAGFGGKAPLPEQRRFVHDAAGYLALVERLCARHATTPDVCVGRAFHSLRAVTPALMADVLAAGGGSGPIHVHVAEQAQEVADCVAWSGQRPVAWLLDHVPVGPAWCLVHATHVDDTELARLAASGAVVGVCPTTEANLGDGLFRAPEYLSAHGALAIGTDSHVNVSIAEELRLLEYGQRLALRQRAVLATDAEPSPGGRLYALAASGAAQALGRPGGRIAPGARADLVVLDPEHDRLAGCAAGEVLDAWIFTGDARAVRDVMVGGVWRVREGSHPDEAAIAARARVAVRRVLT